jgi:TolA-binding protein
MGLIGAIAWDRAAERVSRQLGPTKAKIKALQSEAAVILKEDAELQKKFDKAVKLEAKGDYEQALALYRQIIQRWPDTGIANDSQTCIAAIEKRRA